MLAVLAVLQSMMADRITAFGHVMTVMIYGTAQMIKYRRADAESKSISSFLLTIRLYQPTLPSQEPITSSIVCPDFASIFITYIVSLSF